MCNLPESLARRRVWFLILPGLAALLFVLAQVLRGPGVTELAAAGSAVRAPSDRSDPSVSLASDSRIEPRSAASAETPDALSPTPPREITGVVVDVDGRPVKAARCELFPGTESSGFGTRGSPPAASGTTSDAAGRFRLRAGAGPWRLTVRGEGFARWTADHLHAGDVLDVTLVPASRLSVLVQDEDGLAVSDVHLRVTDAFGDLDAPALAEAWSDVAGRAELAELPAGDHYLAARHDAYEHQFVGFTMPADGASAELGTTLKRGVRLTGTVRVSTGSGEAVAPPEDTRVRVEAFSKGQSLILEATCDAAGGFATEALFGPGEALLATAMAPGFAETSRRLLIDSRAVDEERVELLLGAPGRSATGRAVGGDGAPIARASVQLTSISRVARGMEGLGAAMAEVTPHAERWRECAATDAAGRFRVEGLAADRQYVVLLSAPGSAPSLAWVPESDPGTEVDLGDVMLLRSGSLSGFVRDETGAPVEGERVRATFETILTHGEYEADAWRPARWWRPLTATTRADGSFRFDALAPGSYEVELDGAPVGNWYVPSGEDPGPVELVARAGAGSERIVEGRVADDEGLPVKNALVALFDAEAGPSGWDDPVQPTAMTFTDYRGGFKLRAPEAADYTLQVSDMHGVFVDHLRALRLDEQTGFVAVSLSPDTRPVEPLLGRVLGPDGLPLAGIDVALVPPENAYCGCIAFLAKTDDDGVVQFEQLSRQDHEIVVSDPNGRYRSQVYAPAGPGDYFEVVLRY